MSDLHEKRMERLEAAIVSAKAYGLQVKYMHLSALSPTTRRSHAERHGQLFTAQEVKDFWSDPENAKDCKCSFTQIIVDESGRPLSSIAQKRALSTYKDLQKRGYDWSK